MLSAKPWELRDTAQLFLCVGCCWLFGMTVAGALAAMKLGLHESQVFFLQLLAAMLSLQGTALIWITFFLRARGSSWSEAFGLRPASLWKVIAAGIGAGLCALPLMWLLQLLSENAMEWMKIQPEAQAAVQELAGGSLGIAEKIVFGIFTIVLAPVAEEALFRGILYPAVKQAGFPRLALWGTSLVFALIHFNAASFAALAVLAVILVQLYESTNSLLANIFTHATFNAANFFYLIFADQIDHYLHLQ